MSVDPATEALLADARERAARILADARAQARRRVSEAERAAGETIRRARAQGEATGRLDAEREQALGRTLAHAEVLRARREAYEELRRRGRAAVLRLREEPGYAAFLDRLAAGARRELGPEAQLEIDPPGAGGVRASAGSRRLDYTLQALADGCIGELGPALNELWS